MSPSLHYTPSKRKQPVAGSQVSQPSKKSKKTSDNVKGKGRDREFNLVTSTMVVSVAPVFAGNPRAGVEELLDSLIMRYIPALQGVVLSHSNLTFTSDTGKIKDDCPFLLCPIQFDATVWKPHTGMKLKGRINLSSPDHISLLVHRTFNVSIPRHHIPSDIWEFEYGPAENDPEFANLEEEEKGEDKDEEENEEEREENREDGENVEDDSGSGRWVSRSTGERLGGQDGILQFIVIGLTVANEMLSLAGSLHHDPFSPDHKPYNSAPREIEAREKSPELEEGPAEEEDSDEEEDGFRHLKRKAAAAVEKDEVPVPKPSKKKRKTKKGKDS